MSYFHRYFIWLKRFRHRCGYGVHSPSDFYLITFVMYEKYPYYAYDLLKRKKYVKKHHHYREKINKLLFRMSNYYQPSSFVEVGKESGASMEYMKAACNKMKTFSFNEQSWKTLEGDLMKWFNSNVISSLHIGNTSYYKEIMELALSHVDNKSWIIVGGIHDSKEKEIWWKSVIQDNRVVISFDLYDVGFLFFTSKRYKQNYIVNFL